MEKQNNGLEPLFPSVKETDTPFLPSEAPCLEKVQSINMSSPTNALTNHCTLSLNTLKAKHEEVWNKLSQ